MSPRLPYFCDCSIQYSTAAAIQINKSNSEHSARWDLPRGKLRENVLFVRKRISKGHRVLQTYGNVVPTDILDDPNMWLPDQLRLSKKLEPFEGEGGQILSKSNGIQR